MQPERRERRPRIPKSSKRQQKTAPFWELLERVEYYNEDGDLVTTEWKKKRRYATFKAVVNAQKFFRRVEPQMGFYDWHRFFEQDPPAAAPYFEAYEHGYTSGLNWIGYRNAFRRAKKYIRDRRYVCVDLRKSWDHGFMEGLAHRELLALCSGEPKVENRHHPTSV